MRRRTGATPRAEVGVTAALLVLGHQTARVLEHRLAEVDLGAGEAVVLLALRQGALTMTGVMSTLHIKASTATSLVNRLETLGLVTRAPNPDDRRSLLVELTDAGRRRTTQVLPIFAAMDGAITSKAGGLDLEQLRAALDAMSTESKPKTIPRRGEGVTG